MTPRMQTLPEFLAQPRPEPEELISPWLMQGHIDMLYGERGGGKTNVALAIALAVAGGTELLPQMPALCPRRVLYVDGEMHPAEMQGRFRKLLRGRRCPFPENLIYLTHADYDCGIPDLFAPAGAGQELIEHAIQASGAELIIFDNISALFRTGEENSNDSWVSAGDWLLSLRRQNLTSLLIHHAGKRLLDGSIRQRGASKREDAVNVVIQIDKAARPRDGRVPLRWKYEKYRSFTPNEETFEFSVVFDDRADKAWLEEGHFASIANTQEVPRWLPYAQELQGQGMSLREIAIKCDASKSSVHRWLTGRAFTIGDMAT